MAYRYRLCPDEAQEAVLFEHCAHARFVWNLAVEQQSWWRPGRGQRPWVSGADAAARGGQGRRAVAGAGMIGRSSSRPCEPRPGQGRAEPGHPASCWGLLAARTEQKAAASGAVICYVDPRHSSQQCRRCGHIASESRESQAVFLCVACGHDDHADVNAAKNVLARGLALLAVPAQAPGLRGVRPRKTPASPGAAGTTRQAA